MAVQQWYYRKGKNRFGPVAGEDLKRMARSGELEPEDLLRGVGMSEWIPAGKVKGLFTPAKPQPAPKAEEELGLQTPAVQPASPPKPVPKAPAPHPIPTSQPAPPAAAPPFEMSDQSNPFAQFGLEQTADPFALAEAQTNVYGTAGPEPGLGGVSFDNLAALGSQGQAIHREPPPGAETDPFETKKSAKKNAAPTADLGAAGKIGMLLAPFAVISIFGFAVGAVFGVIVTFVFGLFARIIALFFMFSVASGVAKASGLFAGNCLLRAKIKNEMLSLVYGFFVGLISLYVFMGGMAYSVVNAGRFATQPAGGQAAQQGDGPIERREMDEDGRSLVLRPDEAPVFPNQEAQLEEEPEDDADAEEGMADDEEGMEDDEDAGLWDDDDGDELTPEQRAEMEKNMEGWMKFGATVMHKLQNGLTIFDAIKPFWVFIGFLCAPIFWLFAGFSLLFGTARATWMSNLGFDPTKDD